MQPEVSIQSPQTPETSRFTRKSLPKVGECDRFIFNKSIPTTQVSTVTSHCFLRTRHILKQRQRWSIRLRRVPCQMCRHCGSLLLSGRVHGGGDLGSVSTGENHRL